MLHTITRNSRKLEPQDNCSKMFKNNRVNLEPRGDTAKTTFLSPENVYYHEEFTQDSRKRPSSPYSDHCGKTCSDDDAEGVFELELDWTPVGREIPPMETPKDSLKICKVIDHQAFSRQKSIKIEVGNQAVIAAPAVSSCRCTRCQGRPIQGTAGSRGVKRSPGASPPSKKVMLAKSPVESPRSNIATFGYPQQPPCLLRWDDVYEYTAEAYQWKLTLEDRYWFGCQLALATQTDLTAGMRKTLLLWLVAVMRQFSFTLETWCIAVSLLDRFLAIQPLKRDCLQLAGMSAFFIAAKSEEVEPPQISELISLCAGNYDRKQFQWMEFIMLSHLRFEILSPTAAFFLHHQVELSQLSDSWPYELSINVIEMALSDDMLSNVSASVLANSIFNAIVDNWHPDIVADDEEFLEQLMQIIRCELMA